MTKPPNLVRDLMSVDVVTLGRNDTLVAAFVGILAESDFVKLATH